MLILPGAAALAAHARGRARLRARAGGARARSRPPRLPAANPHQPAANWEPASETFPSPPETARFLLARRAEEGPTRFATLANDFTLRKQLRFGRSRAHAHLLLDMAGTRYGLEDVAGYDPVQLLTYRDAIVASNGNPQSDRHFLWVEVGPRRLLRWLGVRYYVAQDRGRCRAS